MWTVEEHPIFGVEEDTRIFDPELDGFALWPLVRFRAWQIVMGVQTDVTKGSLWTRLRSRPRDMTMPLYAAWSLLQRWRLRGRAPDYLFLSSEAYRSVKRDDGWWDVYLDDIANHPTLAGRVVRGEMRQFAVSPFRTSFPRHLFLDGQVLRQALANQLPMDPEAATAGAQLATLLKDRLLKTGREVPDTQHRMFLDVCVRQANAFRRGLRWYDRLFAHVSPRALVVMTAYGQHAAVAAALRRAIPVIEFQHGLIHGDHPGYIWLASARAARHRLPLPTHIATYGDYWTDLMKARGFWQDGEITSVGSVRMDWIRSRTPSRNPSTTAPRIVFTTQYATRQQTIPFFREFLDLADNANVPLTLTVKVHRAEGAFLDEYRALAERRADVHVRSAYEGDTLGLIAASDLHVSGWSTCHFESVGLGTPTVILRFPGPDRMADLEGVSGVSNVTSPQELLSLVARIKDADIANTASEDAADHLFKRNALKNAVRLLEAVRSGQAAG